MILGMDQRTIGRAQFVCSRRSKGEAAHHSDARMEAHIFRKLQNSSKGRDPGSWDRDTTAMSYSYEDGIQLIMCSLC